MWSIDVVDPLPHSTSEHLFVFVICDSFSKFPLFFPFRKATARSVVKLVKKATQYGLCENGIQFRSQKLGDLANKYDSKVIYEYNQ